MAVWPHYIHSRRPLRTPNRPQMCPVLSITISLVPAYHLLDRFFPLQTGKRHCYSLSILGSLNRNQTPQPRSWPLLWCHILLHLALHPVKVHCSHPGILSMPQGHGAIQPCTSATSHQFSSTIMFSGKLWASWLPYVPTTENLSHEVNFLSLLDTFLIHDRTFDDENLSERGLGVRKHVHTNVMMVSGPFNISQWLDSTVTREVSFLVILDNSLWLWGSGDAQIFRHGFTDAYLWPGTVTEPRRTRYSNSAKAR